MPAASMNWRAPPTVIPAKAGIHDMLNPLYAIGVFAWHRLAPPKSRRYCDQQVEPFGVERLDQANFPRPIPMLKLLLACNRFRHRFEQFVVDERTHAVRLREPFKQSLRMLRHPDRKVARHANVEHAIGFAGEDVHHRDLHGATPVEKNERRCSASAKKLSLVSLRRVVGARLREHDVGEGAARAANIKVFEG